MNDWIKYSDHRFIRRGGLQAHLAWENGEKTFKEELRGGAPIRIFPNGEKIWKFWERNARCEKVMWEL